MKQESNNEIDNDGAQADNWMLPSEALGQHITSTAALFNDSADAETAIRYGYRLGKMGCLVGDGIISEVIFNPIIHPLPSHSKYLVGVINQRGTIVPVFDLIDLFEDTVADRNAQTVLVLGQGNDAAGLIIDDLPQTIQVTDVPCGSIELPEAAIDYITPLFTTHHRPWVDLDYQGLLKHLANRHAQNTDA